MWLVSVFRRKKKDFAQIELTFKTRLGRGLSHIWQIHGLRLGPCIILHFPFFLLIFWLQLAQTVLALLIKEKYSSKPIIISKLQPVTGPIRY